MYFPYLRGKKYELIGLRDLVENELISGKTIPIMEPIKLSRTLILTVKEFVKKETKIGIVINSQVGAFQEDIEELENKDLYEEYKELLNKRNIIKTYLMNKDSDEEIPQLAKDTTLDSFIVCIDNVDYIDVYEKYFNEIKPLYTLMNDESSLRRRIRQNRVLLDDKFNKKSRNVDYLDKDDEFFSEDHLYYKEEGYVGFADFSIEGKEFRESGFAPYAVAGIQHP